MKTYTFTLFLGPILRPIDEIEDRLFEAGCDDALLSFSSGIPILDFDRKSSSFAKAVTSAIKNIERAKLDALVLRVGPDDLVNASEIANRSAVSREAVRLWIQGERGSGDFPPPIARVGQSSVWSWLDISEWLYQREQIDEERVERARFIAAINYYLSKKRIPSLVSQLDDIEKNLY